jgi:hypothetical protein
MGEPKVDLTVPLIGAALAYFGMVGAGFFGLFVIAPAAGLGILLDAPLPLCGLALVALGAMVFMMSRKLRLDGRTAVRLWLGGSAAGFVLWWIVFAALMSTGIDFSEESGAIGMAVVALVGAGLMALTVPPRRTS